MDKLIVTVFDDEAKAYEGLKALKELDADNSITLYATAVVAKNADGVVSVKQTGDQGPAGMAAGLALGSLIGLLGGPVGVAVGAATGTLGGSLYDLAQLGVGTDFLDEVSRHLLPGKTAVLAEVDEEWVTPLDTRMEALGGVVIRRARAEFVDAQIEREAEADRAELAQLKAEHAQAVGKAKAKLQAKVDAVEKRLRARRDQLDQKIATDADMPLENGGENSRRRLLKASSTHRLPLVSKLTPDGLHSALGVALQLPAWFKEEDPSTRDADIPVVNGGTNSTVLLLYVSATQRSPLLSKAIPPGALSCELDAP